MSDDLERRIEALERHTGIDAPEPPSFSIFFIAPGESEDDAMNAVVATRVMVNGKSELIKRILNESMEDFRNRVDDLDELVPGRPTLRFWLRDDECE